MPLLEVEDLDVRYGEVHALHRASLHVEPGEIVCVVGPNGAGKSTLMRTISGLIKPVAGSIRYEGRELTRSAPRDITRLGIAHSPEGRRIFPGLTVAENLEVATAPWRRRRESI